MPSHRSALLVLLAATAFAAEPPAIPPADAPPPPWTWKGKLGVFMQNTASHNAEVSRDPSISGTTDSLSYKLSGALGATWKEDKNRLEQTLEADYGEIRTEESNTWQENADRIAYAITYERTLETPQFMYLNGTAESVFTGSEPDKEPLDPLIAKLSTGYGHRYEGLLPEKDLLVWRVGVFARKRWQHDAPEYETDVQTGPELYVRYERKQSEDVSYFIQNEIYGDFADTGHVSDLAQAGLSVRVTRLLSVEVKARAFYESRPDAAGDDELGYDRWSLRQEALIGLLWKFATN